MLWSSIIVAVLLFTVAAFVLLEAFRPILRLGAAPETQDREPQPRDESDIDGTNDVIARFVSGLSERDREGFRLLWLSVRDEFDADPSLGLRHADLLMSDLIQDYRPSGDHPADLLADGPIKTDYRSAHEIALRSTQGRLQRVELERALGLYTALFDELLGDETRSASHRPAA